jgi:hypothetical protein
MGQTIEVKSTPIGDVALFDTDRSLTGQDSHSFAGTSDSADPPATLANRLFDSDPSILHVQILSNTVSIERDSGWDNASLAAARSVIANLFVFYDGVLTHLRASARRTTTRPSAIFERTTTNCG